MSQYPPTFEAGPLDPDEIKLLSFPFASELGTGVSLASVSAEASLKRGTDSSPDALRVGSPVIVGTEVQQRISGAGRTVGAIYHVRVRAVDSDGLAHVMAADVPVLRQ